MKYVRTTDGQILERRGMRFVEASHGPNYYVRAGTGDYSHYVPYKEANTIDELCDEYILENKDHTYQSLLVKSDHYDKRSFSDSFTKDVKSGWLSYCCEYLQNGFEIYGAVFVRGEHDEPILKPAAKMKREGNWELL